MKTSDVKIGGVYRAKVSDKLTDVRIDEAHPDGGWTATNLATTKSVRIKTARRLRAASDSATRATRTPRAAKGTKKATAARPKAKNATRANVAAQTAKGNAKPKPKRTSLLDLAADVLKNAKNPMTSKEIVERVLESGAWTTTGKTPHATLYAAMIREIAKKGKDARFKKVERGLFTAA